MQRKLRVVSFNIKGAKVPGRSDRATQERAWHLLAAYGADIGLIQEAEHKAIPTWARERWSIIQGGPASLGSNPAGWGSVLAALPHLNMQNRDDLLGDPKIALIYDYAVFAEIELPDGENAIVSSVHAPANKLPEYLRIMAQEGSLTSEEMKAMAQPGDKAWAVDLFFSAIAQIVKNCRFIIGGDWNNSRLFDLNSKQRKTGQLPYGTMFFTRARDSGWFDCHAGKNEERSFLREGSLPHQLDHIFSDQMTFKRLEDCSVRTDWVVYELSDHAPLITDFNWS